MEIYMNNYMYWVTTLMLAVVLFIIYIGEKYQYSRNNKGLKSFQIMVLFTMYFCLQDAFWGLCDCSIIKGERVFFLSSSLFHISVIFSTLFWLRFIIDYLGDDVKYKKIYFALCHLLIVVQVVLVTINFFQPVIFSIKDGRYVAEAFRSWTFLNQYVVYAGSGAVPLLYLFSNGIRNKDRDKLLTVAAFSIAPIVMGILQLLFPEAPFYSIGYFFVCFIVHIFIVSRERDELSKSAIINAITDIYYTMHLFDLNNNILVDYIESDIVNSLIKDRNDPQGAINAVMEASASDEYKDVVFEFVDLSTLPERLSNTAQITMDFIGNFHGWTRASFIPVERDESGKLLSAMFTTQIIDEQRKKEQEMLSKAVSDQLTGLYNRRAYESYISEFSDSMDNIVYISADVNGLKNVNDNLGHGAGDELLAGAAKCMKQCFGPYGKIFRTGGDEFVMILSASDSELLKIKADFEEVTDSWRGELVDSVKISCGYVSRGECCNRSFEEIEKLAEQRMYAEKTLFYQRKGIDRRGQNEAHKVLCASYAKILKINITDDSFSTVNMDFNEQKYTKEYSGKVTELLNGFAESGLIHEDDSKKFIEKTDINYMRNYFKQNDKALTILYRRKDNDEFQKTLVEIVPASDYSDENQSLFLYVKRIDITDAG